MEESKENKLLTKMVKYILIIALLPKYFQMFIFIAIMGYCIIKNRCKITVYNEAIPFIMVGVVQILAIIINMVSIHEISRVLASLNTAFLWIFSGIYFSIAKKDGINLKKIEKYMFYNMVILIFVSVIAIILNKMGYYNIRLGSRFFITEDWKGNIKTYRLIGYMEYSNLITLIYFLIFPYVYDYLISTKKRWYQIFFLLISALPVILNKSRVGILVEIITLIMILPKLTSNKPKIRKRIVIIFIIMIIFFFLMNFQSVYNSFYELVDSRAGSTGMRTNIYKTSIETTMNKSPIIGCGIKDLINGYPLGSHSTYIGVFYKTGFIGIILAFIGFTNLLIKIIQKRKKYFYFLFILLFIFCFEDIDGANWYMILFFTLFGNLLKCNIGKEVNGYTEKK